MSNKLTDHDIAFLYQKGADEQPSDKLDAHILQLAKSQQASPSPKKIRFYQTWYAQLSTAASFVLVAVLYFEIHQPFVEQQNEWLELPSINQHSDSLEIQDEQLLGDSLLINKKEQEVHIKQAKSRAQQAQRKMSKIAEMPPLERPKVQLSDSSQSSKESEIEFLFKEIEELVTQGRYSQAESRLKMLINKHPELKQEIDSRYQQLLKKVSR